MAIDHPPAAESPASRSRKRRLRALLVVAGLSLALSAFVGLDRSVVEKLGPWAEGIHDLFNQEPGKAAPLTAAARALAKDVKALGGDASISVTSPGFFGTIGQVEWVNVTFRGRRFDDAALARLAESHGDRIGGLYLDDTGVTDAGLASLRRFTMLRHLVIRNDPGRKGRPTITDAGLVHLKGLDHLWSLDLGDQPISDSGLGAIEGLPELDSLYLNRTKVKGGGLARLKSLPRLTVLYLDECPVTLEALNTLTGATSLQVLSVKQVPLTSAALPIFGAIPRLDRLEITGCGFLDEEIVPFVKRKPGLRVVR